MSHGNCLGIKRELKSSHIWAPLIYVALGLIYVAEQNELACRVGVESRYARSDDRSVCVCVCERARSDITHVLD